MAASRRRGSGSSLGYLSPAAFEKLRVTLYRESIGPVKLSDHVDKSILDLLARHPGRTTAELARHIRLSVRATSTRLSRLAGQGLIVAIGKSLRDPRRAYYLAGTELARSYWRLRLAFWNAVG